jgi:hypothetical protein
VRYLRASDTTTEYEEGARGPSPGTEGDPYPDPVAGLSGGRVYRPVGQKQMGWGTKYDSSNCNMASSAMALERHSLGYFHPNRTSNGPASTPPNHRYFSRSTSLLGTTMQDAVRAWSNGWKEDLIWPGPVPWDYFVSQINSGRGAIAWGLYSAMHPSYRKGTFAGTHAIYVNEQFEDGSFWAVDPLYGYAKIYPRSVLYNYMQPSASGNNVIASFTLRTPVV